MSARPAREPDPGATAPQERASSSGANEVLLRAAEILAREHPANIDDLLGKVDQIEQLSRSARPTQREERAATWLIETGDLADAPSLFDHAVFKKVLARLRNSSTMSWPKSITIGPIELAPLSISTSARASLQALEAKSTVEFGAALAALREERRRSIGDILRSDKEKWFSRSTLSRACSGETLFRHKEAVVAFVRACGVTWDAEVQAWVTAWERVREAEKTRQRSGKPPAKTSGATTHALTAEDTAPCADAVVATVDTAPGAAPGLASIEGQDTLDKPAASVEKSNSMASRADEVAFVVNMPVTYRHLEMATGLSAGVAVGALAALAAGNLSADAAILITAIAAAGTLALHEWARTAAPLQPDRVHTDSAAAGEPRTVVELNPPPAEAG